MELDFEWSESVEAELMAAAEAEIQLMLKQGGYFGLCAERPLTVGLAPIEVRDFVLAGALRCPTGNILTTFTLTRKGVTVHYSAEAACESCRRLATGDLHSG